jgi:hypothetical protein
MKGHLRERPKGSGNWAIVLDVRDPQTVSASAAGIASKGQSERHKSGAPN